MPTLIASALVAGFFIITGAQAASAPTATTTAVDIPPLPTLTATMTSYNAVPDQTKPDPSYTASGLPSNSEVIAARSVDLAKELPFGTVIEIERTAPDTPLCHYSLVEPQIGYRVIGDTMNSRFTDRIDVLLDQTNTVQVGGVAMNPSIALGLCSSVTVRIVGYMPLSQVPATQTELDQMVAGNQVALAD